MGIHSVKSTVVLTVTVSGMMPSLLQNFTILTYYDRTLVKHSIQITIRASIYGKQLHTQRQDIDRGTLIVASGTPTC
jgi:hypothetical protein